jgi:hypothetical protein
VVQVELGVVAQVALDQEKVEMVDLAAGVVVDQAPEDKEVVMVAARILIIMELGVVELL